MLSRLQEFDRIVLKACCKVEQSCQADYLHIDDLPASIPMKAIRSWRNVLLAALAMPLACHAALGDKAASVQSDQRNMRAAARGMQSHDQYKVHEMQGEAGTIVREYESPEGVIFAVAWEGPVKPDLKQLFGKYYDQYRDAGRTASAGHRHSTVRQSNLVVRSSGHVRAFSGLAYLPGQVPPGVNIDELQ
jgi:hypothetical protein